MWYLKLRKSVELINQALSQSQTRTIVLQFWKANRTRRYFGSCANSLAPKAEAVVMGAAVLYRNAISYIIYRGTVKKNNTTINLSTYIYKNLTH